MGLRACALKKHDIELGEHQVLNWGSDSLAMVINEFCEDAFTGGDYDETNMTWSVNKEQFKEMIDKIENEVTDEEFLELYSYNEEFDRKTMLDSLKKLYEDGIQAGQDYIYIVWV